MNNEIKHNIELTSIEILDLRAACSLVKELSDDSLKWENLRDKLDKELNKILFSN